MTKAEPQVVKKEEFELSQELPAIYANKFFISFTPLGVRISFAEGHPNISMPVMRAAVIIPYEDAIALKDVLGQMIENSLQQITTEQAKKYAGD